MSVVKSIGKFFLFSLLYLSMFFVYILLLFIYAWFEEQAFFSWVFNFFNNVTFGGTFVFFFQIARCSLINEALLYVSKRLSGHLPLFVFSVLLSLFSVFALFSPGSVMSFIITIIELIFAVILAVKSFKLFRQN
jgi:hypothetical protein